MKKVIIVFCFLVFLCPIGADAAELRVPQEYPQVSDALLVATDGDTVLVSPGVYTDTTFWIIGWGISVRGLGDFPSEVHYQIPLDSQYKAVYMYDRSRLENLFLSNNNQNIGCVIAVTAATTEGVLITNMVVNAQSCIWIADNNKGIVKNVTLIGTGNNAGTAITCGSGSPVTGCVFLNVERGMAFCVTEESYNLFWNVKTPIGYHADPCEPDPSDLIADPMLDPMTFVPGYQSPVVDSGEPGYFDPDGTIIDRGAVYRSQVLYTLEFLADPKDEVKIGLPRRQGLPPRMFHAGERFVLATRLVKIDHPPNLHIEPTSAYLALECYGTFYWAPIWTEEVNCTTVNISDGYDVQTTVFDFIWPTVSGSASGLHFWSTTITNSCWIGPIACLEFGYE